MRFFSNDARESTDEQSADDQAKDQAHDDQPDRVQSDPVAVPNQRPPSPWSNAPAATDDPARPDGPDADAVTSRDDADAPPFHEPGPQPTAFGASTVGGAVAASATANPENDRWDATDRDSAADSGVGDDATVAPGDGVVSSSTTTYAGETADRDPDAAPDTVPATWTEHDTSDARDRTDADDVVDVPLDDKDSADTAVVSDQPGDVDADREVNRDDSVTTYDDGPDRTETDAVADSPADSPADSVTDSSADSVADDSTVDDDRTDTDTDTGAAPLKDDGGFDDPKAVDPVTETPLDEDSTEPAVVAAAVPAAAATPAVATGVDTLFDQDDARSFQERWRDVQLRFVDSPKEAAGDAAKLVDEAVEKLTASLRGQREGLNNDTEDTEQLRVQLRGYREILNRILSL